MSLAVKQEHDALDDDLFAAGFDESLGGNPGDTNEVVDETPGDETGTSEADEVVVASTSDEEVVTPVAETPKAPQVDTQRLVDEAVAAALAAVKVPEVPTEKDTPAAPTAEELAAEEQYRKDWPEHAAREDRLKSEITELKALLTTTVEALKGQIAPVIQQNNLSAEEKHYNTIYSAHADADALAPKVFEWIATQPKFLQPQYAEVMNNGSAADIVDLFTFYKTAVGGQPQQLDDTTGADLGKAEATGRLKRMTPPTALRTSVTAEEDPDDFDGAFEAGLKGLKIAA